MAAASRGQGLVGRHQVVKVSGVDFMVTDGGVRGLREIVRRP